MNMVGVTLAIIFEGYMIYSVLRDIRDELRKLNKDK